MEGYFLMYKADVNLRFVIQCNDVLLYFLVHREEIIYQILKDKKETEDRVQECKNSCGVECDLLYTGRYIN